jgi:hypothetical protein
MNALTLTLLNNPVQIGRPAQFQWNAVAADPKDFLVGVIDGNFEQNLPFVREGGNIFQGTGETAPLNVSG